MPGFGWIQQINQEVLETNNGVIIVAHSLGASMLLKYLSEHPVNKKIRAVFLVSTPFWIGNENWKSALKLRENFADKLPEEVPLFFYHCEDDKVAPFSDLHLYRQKVTQATFREIKSRGHQLNNDLSFVTQDIKSLS